MFLSASSFHKRSHQPAMASRFVALRRAGSRLPWPSSQTSCVVNMLTQDGLQASRQRLVHTARQHRQRQPWAASSRPCERHTRHSPTGLGNIRSSRCVNGTVQIFLRWKYQSSRSQGARNEGEGEGVSLPEQSAHPGVGGPDATHAVLQLQQATSSGEFAAAVLAYAATQPARGHVSFIRTALSIMDERGITPCTAVYDALFDVFPQRGSFRVTSWLDSVWPRETLQSRCALEVVEHMEEAGVIPDASTHTKLLQVTLSRASVVYKQAAVVELLGKPTALNTTPHAGVWNCKRSGQETSPAGLLDEAVCLCQPFCLASDSAGATRRGSKAGFAPHRRTSGDAVGLAM
eukprot:m.91903 g.91903  ORF g.91903 m.91903 type:complete len:347 (-) comp15054_c0_seq5:346-1386(-)